MKDRGEKRIQTQCAVTLRCEDISQLKNEVLLLASAGSSMFSLENNKKRERKQNQMSQETW